MKKILFFFVVLLTSVQIMAQDVTDGRRYFSFIVENYETGVTDVPSDQQFQSFLQSGATIMAMFTAQWCGPCKMVFPYFSSLATKYPSIAFITVDVDICPNTAAEQEISFMPTFILYKDGYKVCEILGANIKQLDSILDVASH